MEIEIRTLRPSDHARVIAVVDGWWGGRPMSGMLPALFFRHFENTSFVAERRGELVGFLVGFFSQSRDEEAYIHFVGVHPEHRQRGLARSLYERFLALARAASRTTVRCVTSPDNGRSIAFHRGLGFAIVPGDDMREGLSVHRDYDGPGEDRVLFCSSLREASDAR